MARPVTTAVGGAGAAIGSMLCCTGPLVATSLGLSGATLAVFLPYRPLFVLAAVGLIYVAFRQLDRSASPAEPLDSSATGCSPRARRRTVALVWALAGFSIVMLTSPLWDDFVFRP